MERRTRVAVANDYEIVVAGLAAMLDRHEDIDVVDMFIVGESGPSEPLDIVLYDTFGRDGVDQDQLKTLVATPLVNHVVVYTLSWADPLTQSALQHGVSGVLSKALDGEELADRLREIAEGTVVVAPPPHGRIVSGTGRDWPGRSFGLSERESECLVLLAAGPSQRRDRPLALCERGHGQDPPQAGLSQARGQQSSAGDVDRASPPVVHRCRDGRLIGPQSAAASSVPASANARHSSA